MILEIRVEKQITLSKELYPKFILDSEIAEMG